jgi:pantothenate kinase
MNETVVDIDVRSLADRLRGFSDQRARTLVGLCGPPGVGKSTLAATLAASLGPATAAVLPMDGFHLSNQVLVTLGLSDRKGAPETFDVDGFAATLARLSDPMEPVVYVSEFRRDLDESVAGAVAIHQSVPVVIVEGNYLLSRDPSWRRARSHLNEVWYLHIDETVRTQRLVSRHKHFGRSHEEAVAWVHDVDDLNARRIVAAAHFADQRFRVTDG